MAGRDHDALGEDANRALAVASSHAWSTAGRDRACCHVHSQTSLPGGPAGNGERALLPHLHPGRPQRPPAAGPSPQAAGQSSRAGPPPGRGLAGRLLPVAEGNCRVSGARGPWASTKATPRRPRPWAPEAHPAPELQPCGARSCVPPGPLQRPVLRQGHPAPAVTGLPVAAERRISAGSGGLPACAGRGPGAAADPGHPQPLVRQPLCQLRPLPGAERCPPELPALGLGREGLAQQGPQAGQAGSSRGLQGQGEGTLHRDGHRACAVPRGHSLGPGREVVGL